MRLRFLSIILAAFSIVAAAVFFSGCSSTSTDAYNQQVSEANTAYQAGKITPAEYLKLKQDAQNAYLARQQNN
jgi:PBP1b-binding outer membrane lipoprotein LpoB